MHHKAIKAQIRKQLKTRYLNWHRLAKKEKKAVAKKVLDEMERFIDNHKNSVLFKLSSKKRNPLHIKDEELRFIDDLLDDQIINKLLAYEGYAPAMILKCFGKE